MNELFLVRMFAYSLLPLLLAVGHILFDKQASTSSRRIEVFLIYLLAISVGANGLGGAFGHLFLSDLIAESIGWPAGNPFQLEMGFANLTLGILGLVAMGRRDGFRAATIIATTVIGLGATAVHLLDIAMHGNLAPGNTIQNISNLLDPILLVGLTWWSSQLVTSATDRPDFLRWQERQLPIAGFAAAGIGLGFGLGFALNGLLLWTLTGCLIGVGIGIGISKRTTHGNRPLGVEQF